MLSQPTIDKLQAMRLEPMIQAWQALDRDESARALPFEDKLALLVDRLYDCRQNLALARRLRYAKFRLKATVEDLDFRARKLDRSVIRALTLDSAWVRRHEQIFI